MATEVVRLLEHEVAPARLVMEVLDKLSVPVPRGAGLRMVQQLVAAVRYVHWMDVCHRDLKARSQVCCGLFSS